MKYIHKETGAVDTKEGWILSYDSQELEDRDLSAREAFAEDLDVTLFAVIDNPARALGSIRTEKKATASRENGKKGGRPRKPAEK